MHVALCCAYSRNGRIESLVQELDCPGVALHLWALDAPLPALQHWTRGAGPLNRFQAYTQLLRHCAGADLVLFADDHVRLGPDFLPAFAATVNELHAAIAQPALRAGSPISHAITREHRGCWARETNFVEAGPLFSMTQAFLDRVTPFPPCHPLGGGLEAYWSAEARAHGLCMAIIDTCPVDHALPSPAPEAAGDAWQAMQCFLRQQRLTWQEPRVLRSYRRIYSGRADYLEAFPPRASAGAALPDLALLEAVASLVRPALLLALGSAATVCTKQLAQAASAWHGRLIHEPRPPEELFADWSTPVDFLLLPPAPASPESIRGWLNSWCRAWLAEGGVAVFPDASQLVAATVQDWLREQPRGWYWQEFVTGMALLWRLHGPLSMGPAPGEVRVTRQSPQTSILIAGGEPGQDVAPALTACREIDCEILVAADPATDGAMAALRQRFPQARLISHAVHRGLAAAWDLAARQAQGDVLIFLDARYRPEPGALARLAADVTQLAGQAVVIPWQPENQCRLDLATLSPAPMDLERMPRRGRFHEAATAAGGCLAIGRDLYERLWGFDPNLQVVALAAADFAWKAWLAGAAVLLDPEATIALQLPATESNRLDPATMVLADQLRMARKNLQDATWADWIERARGRHAKDCWEAAWALFQAGQASLERERAGLAKDRVHDEFWYAVQFGLRWPRRPDRPRTHPETNGQLMAAKTAPKAPPPAAPDPAILTVTLRLNQASTVPVSIDQAAVEVEGNEELAARARELVARVVGRPLPWVRALRPEELLTAASHPCGNGQNGNPDLHTAQLVVAALRKALARLPGTAAG
jgi:hypothetical protein